MSDVRTILERGVSGATPPPDGFERMLRRRDRKRRNERIAAGAVALAIMIAVVVATIAIDHRDAPVPATPPQNGRIVVWAQQPQQHQHHRFTVTMNPDGTDVRDLSVKSGFCASWAPDGRKILIDFHGLATINPDGTGYTELDDNTRTEGCGAFSPDGTRIVIGGSTELEPDSYFPWEHGIFTVRASDGGDLVRLTPRNGTNPNYSPDGTQVVFKGVQGPHGACVPHSPPGGGGFTCPPGTYRIGESDGSVLVVNADGSGLHRIASQSGELPSWSPDGRWILLGTTLNDVGFSVVHPDGTGLRKITLEVVPGLRQALYPSWSPDGTRFVFVGQGSDGLNLFTARTDGTDVEQITHTRGIYYLSPDWGTNAG